MTNAELIERLKALPANAEVAILSGFDEDPIYPNAVIYSKKDDEITIFRTPFEENF